MPGRARKAKAQQLADKWHGKAVVHTSKGRRRYARVVFQGPYQRRWFRLHWQDGSSTEHTASILNHVLVVDEHVLPVALPPIPPLLRIVVARAHAQLNDVLTRMRLSPTTRSESVRLLLQYTMSTCAVDDRWLGRIVLSVDSVCKGDPLQVYVCAQAAQALESIWPLSADCTCLLPLAVSVPAWLVPVVERCFVNSFRPQRAGHTNFDPLSTALHEFYASGVGIDCYVLAVAPELLDLMLPLALVYAHRLVVAYVPVTYVTHAESHRHAWFAGLRREHRLLVVHVEPSQGPALTHGWLLLFPTQSMRMSMFPSTCAHCLWRESHPEQLHAL